MNERILLIEETNIANLTIVANTKRKMRALLTLALVSVATAACTSLQAASDITAAKPAAEPTSRVVLTSEVKWDQLNPARGDKSPKAGTLWGDREGWITYPRSIDAQQKIITSWRERVKAVGGPAKPAVQSLYVDLVDAPEATPQPIHL